MSGVVFAAVVVIVLFAFAGGYVWGWLNGTASVVDECRHRERAEAADQAARRWRGRAEKLERTLAQRDHDLTATTELLLAEIDKAVDHGLRDHDLSASCDWCDARPVPYVLVDESEAVALRRDLMGASAE